MKKISINQTLDNWLPALLREIELGNPDAMGVLGYMYQTGTGGVEKDEAKAKAYFEMEKNTPPLTDAELEELDRTHPNPWIGKIQEV